MTTINEQYVKQTIDAMADNRLITSVVADQITRLPAREQSRFFKLAINYIEIVASTAKSGYALAGMEQIARACLELLDVIELHFPAAEAGTYQGREYVQL